MNLLFKAYMPTIIFADPTSSINKSKVNLFTLDEILFDNRGDAELVLLKLKEMINRYGMASAGDYYQIAQQPYVLNAEKVGWKDLSSAHISQRGDKYEITFPKLLSLK